MNYYSDVLKKYAVFSGRARRKEYWMFVLINTIISIVLGWAASTNNQVLVGVSYLYVLAVLIPSIAVFVRRLHDTNHSGWWIFIGLIPLVGAIILLVFSVKDSQPGDNQYGPNPKGMGGPQVGAASSAAL
jgi:uncharacterized membrane protein YhaH (DUF805 family)